ncbi:MAG: phage tail tube protein [Christensenellales bacterium]|jgi:hypothetical protein
MSNINTAPSVDVRKVMSGKDGALYDDQGQLLVSVENFNSQVAINNQTFQPLGSAQERSAMTSYKVTLTFTEVVVESGRFFRLIMNALKTGRMPVLNFRGMGKSPYDNSEEQVVYRNCVPDGTLDIQNMQPGELCKRTWNWVVNDPPDLQKLLRNR